jgi:CRP/FNR family transcriptional regulator
MMPASALYALRALPGTSDDVVSALAKRGVEVRFRPGEVLFRAGSQPRGWYLVLEGSVRVVRGPHTRQHVVHTEGPGGSLGEVPLFGGATHPATGIATEPTRCALFSRAAIEGAIAEAPGVAFMLLGRLAHRVRALVERLDERTARSVQTRLVEFLLSRPPAGCSGHMSLGMTQQALAEELGTVREVIARALRELRRQGLIEALSGGRYRLVDVVALRRVVE